MSSPARRLEFQFKKNGSAVSEHLEKVSLFQEIKDKKDAIGFFATFMHEKNFKKGAEMISEGTVSSEMFFLISGEATVQKTTPDGEKFRVASFTGATHPFFGEGGLIDTDVRSATIIADTDCHCLVFGKDDFEKLCVDHPDWALPFFRRIASLTLSRLRKTNNDLSLVYNALVNEIRGK